ncbi:hypothetical protein, partial [Pseudomonas aeruginosa]
FAPALADRAILPKAWGSSYFFNRIGQKQTLLTTNVCFELTDNHALGDSARACPAMVAQLPLPPKEGIMPPQP